MGHFGSFGIGFSLSKALKMAGAYVFIVSLDFLKSTSLCPLVFQKFQLPYSLEIMTGHKNQVIDFLERRIVESGVTSRAA